MKDNWMLNFISWYEDNDPHNDLVVSKKEYPSSVPPTQPKKQKGKKKILFTSTHSQTTPPHGNDRH